MDVIDADALVSNPTRNKPNEGRSKIRTVRSKGAVRRINSLPDDIVMNAELNSAVLLLPANYNFELHKTIYRIRQDNVHTVTLQFPEGLLMYACVIQDIITKFTQARVIIMGDVTYGACCVDDFTANKLESSLIIHYGHSCLVPIGVTTVKVLYVFVEIKFDDAHLVACIKSNFSPNDKIALMGTVQFTNALHSVIGKLRDDFPNVSIPQCKPLSSGETLGCTSPVLINKDKLVFVADGRFHLEAAMIQNPQVSAYRYDPYGKSISSEGYDHVRMKDTRWRSITTARNSRIFGVVLGTLGRQGNPRIVKAICSSLRNAGKVVVQFLMAEILPAKLALIKGIEVWVQVACPRLSIDWGEGFSQPILNPYELEVALGKQEWQQRAYPMDYYGAHGINARS